MPTTSSDLLPILALSVFIGAGLRLLESKGVDISDIDWSKCYAFLVDERCVPLDHDDRYSTLLDARHVIEVLECSSLDAPHSAEQFIYFDSFRVYPLFLSSSYAY